jgi:hypothetical protein
MANNTAAKAALAAAATPGAVKNCTWSNNNAACVNTWFCLSKKVLGQFDATFAAAETITMDQLVYWNAVAPDGNRQVEAQSLADILTKLFTNVLGATYEPKQNYASAVNAMTTVLTDATKTVCELAAVVDELHHFPTEASP